jgi:hypothetical protein
MLEALKSMMFEQPPVKGEAAKASPEQLDALGESLDFANELLASMDGEFAVTPVEAAPGKTLEIPSELLQSAPSGHPDKINPKLFDPAMTRGVEGLFQPKTTEVPLDPETVNPLEQLLTKAGKPAELGGAQSPLVEGEKASKLPVMEVEDFIQQKNAAMKKNLSSSPYGMKQANPVAMENELKTTQVVNGTSEAALSGEHPVKSQEFILGLMAGGAAEGPVAKTDAPAKVMDMTQIKSADSSEIMGQISDYIIQAKAAKEPTASLRMNHEELGMIDITVSKTGVNSEAIAVNIGAHSAEGKNFFQANSKELLAQLSGSGLTVSDLKVETPAQTAKSDFDMNGQQGKQDPSNKNFGSEQNQRRNEAERRQSLWDILSDKEAA